MARTETTTPPPAPIGHNKGPNEALFISHLSKLRAQQAKVNAKKAELDAERASLNDLYNLAKGDKFSRKELSAILVDSASSHRNLLEEEQRRAQLRAWAGLPAGSQSDLFDGPSLAVDEIAARGQGYSAGLRGDEAKLPAHIGENHLQAFMAGWHEGQEKLAWALGETSAPEAVNGGPATAPAEPDMLGAIAEVEPELVAQVVEDHGADSYTQQ